MNVKKIANTEHFRKMKDYWNFVLDRCESNFPFLTHEWLFSWWIHFQKNRKLYILAAYEKEDASPSSIAPFMLGKKAGFRIIEFIGSGPSDYLDFIIPHKNKDHIKSLISFVNRDRNSWDLIFLRELEWNVATINQMSREAREAGLEVYIYKSSICPYLSIKSNWDKFISSKTSKFRYNRKREEERFQKEGLNFKILKIQSKNFNQSIFEDMVEIEKYSWKSGTQAAKMQERCGNAFYYNFLKEFARKDWLTIWLAHLDKKPVAYLINFDYREKIWFYNTAYDMRFKNYGVGSILVKRSLEDAFSSGKREFDFLRGEENYKAMWASDKRQLFQIIIYKKKNLLSLLCFILLFRAKWSLAKMKKILKNLT